MITQVKTVEQLKQLYSELFLAMTDNVSKISPDSNLNAHAFGVGKTAQRILKDIAIIEGNIFPQTGFGTQLDNIANLYGITARRGAVGSSTYVRLVGAVGTAYVAGTHQFTGSHGVVFDLDASVTIGNTGFEYAKVSSSTTGSATNVDPFTLNSIVSSPPTGHQYVTNEYRASGGYDSETDELFRRRIMESFNILSVGTLAKYEQILMKYNSKVLRAYADGFDAATMKPIIRVASVNGSLFSSVELTTLEANLWSYLSLNDISNGGVELTNITHWPVDVSLRVELEAGADNDTVRREMQINMQKVMDWNVFEQGSTIEWESLAIAAKRTKNVKRILDNYFYPNTDIQPPQISLPRIRSFTMYDTGGTILSSVTTLLNPVYFPNQPDWVIQNNL